MNSIRVLDEKQLATEFPAVHSIAGDAATVISFRQFFIVGNKSDLRTYLYSHHDQGHVYSYGADEIGIFETDLSVSFTERVAILCAQQPQTSQDLIDATRDLFMLCNDRIMQCRNILKSHGISCEFRGPRAFANYINEYYSEHAPIHHSIFTQPLSIYCVLPCKINPIYLRRHVTEYLRKVAKDISAVCDIHADGSDAIAGVARKNILDHATHSEFQDIYDHRSYGWLVEYLFFPDSENVIMFRRLLSRVTTVPYVFPRSSAR